MRLIGRDRERRELHQRLTARESYGEVIIVSGEAGLGKSVLVSSVLDEADIPYSIGRSVSSETPPYAPLADVLRGWLRIQGADEREMLSRYPALRMLIPSHDRPAVASEKPALLDAIYAVLRLHSKNRSVLWLEDIHWADDATLEILPDLAEKIAALPIGLIATYRWEDITHTHRLRWLRSELRRRHLLTEFALKPIYRESAKDLIRTVLGEEPSDHLTDLVYDLTQGVPFYVVELVTALAARAEIQSLDEGADVFPGTVLPVPESIRDTVLVRLESLSKDERAILEVAAVAGLQFPCDLLAAFAESSEVVDVLFDTGVLVETPDRKALFRHNLVREAVYAEVGWSRKRWLHGEIAGHLERMKESPEVVAEHWLAAHQEQKARAAFVLSARQSCAIHAYRDAARFASRALDLWQQGVDEEERLATLRQYARCVEVTGNYTHAEKALREILDSISAERDLNVLGDTHRALAAVYEMQGFYELSIKERMTAAKAFEDGGMYADAAAEILAAAGKQTALLQLKSALQSCEEAIELSQKASRKDLMAKSMGLKGNVLAMTGNEQAGIKTAQEALSLALDEHNAEAAAEAYRRLGSAFEYSGKYDDSRNVYSTAHIYCKKEGVKGQAQLCMSCMSYVLFRTGDWRRCIEISLDVLNDAEAPNGSKAVSAGALGLIHLYKGEIKQAKSLITESVDLSRRYNVKAMSIVGAWAMGILRAQEGQTRAATEHFQTMLALHKEFHNFHDVLPGLAAAAAFYGSNGMETELSECINTLALISNRTANPEALGVVAFGLGEGAMLREDYTDAAGHFAAAVSHFTTVHIPVELLQAEFRWACALGNSGDTAAAQVKFGSAFRRAKNLGARMLARTIEETMAEFGLQAEQIHTDPLGAPNERLTRRQIEIAKFIADGLTNRQIADKLFLSPRTVEMHVANLLDRLDCHTRTEAVTKAASLGLIEV